MTVQKHHIIYGQDKPKQREVVVNIYQGEHWILTLMNRMVNISNGFIKSLDVWLALHRDKGVEL